MSIKVAMSSWAFWKDIKEEYSEFAKDDYLLSFTNDSRACDIIWEANDWQIFTSGSTGRHTAFISRRNAYILKSFEGGYENRGWNQKLLKHDGWTVWYWDASKYELNCSSIQEYQTRYTVPLEEQQ